MLKVEKVCESAPKGQENGVKSWESVPKVEKVEESMQNLGI